MDRTGVPGATPDTSSPDHLVTQGTETRGAIGIWWLIQSSGAARLREINSNDPVLTQWQGPSVAHRGLGLTENRAEAG